DTAPERQRPNALGDPRADGLAPEGVRDRRADAREAALAGSVEDTVERLGRSELRPARSHDDSRRLPRFGARAFGQGERSADDTRRRVPSGAAGSKVAPRRSAVPVLTRPSARSNAYAAPGRGTSDPSGTT